MTRLLHFTLGPVQGFIADARRTRDLWAGSFLLSWLSGQAMAALVKARGQIVFPKVDEDDLFQAIQKHHDGGKTELTPYIGSLPNRFKADVTNVKGDPGRICKDAIEKAWRDLAQAVWDQFINGDVADKGNHTAEIWDRQVNNFWEMNWVIGDETFDQDQKPLDGNWLDRRKNWRSQIQIEPEDSADLCRLMGGYQEISGFSRIGERKKQDTFYNALRSRKYKHPEGPRALQDLNIGQTERLCALALIKRLFPLLDNIEKVIGWRPGGSEVNIVNWPSVSYIAAIPWLKGVEAHEVLEEYCKAVKNSGLKSYKGETETKLFDLPDPDKEFYKLDGHLLHIDGIRNWKLADFNGSDDEQKRKHQNELVKAYGELPKALKNPKTDTPATPSEFYAILLMDGDRIGAQIRDHEQVIQEGLDLFTRAVKTYFHPNESGPNDPDKNPANGALIYAGGDDVLALVPLDTAIEAARHLRKAYEEAFAKAIKKAKKTDLAPSGFTLSGAIIFAQYKIPLRAVLDKARHYLDRVAKDKNGRDSLALAVMKPGGVAFDWVSCWTEDPVATMEKIARDRSDYSSSFFYNLRQRYAPLFAGDEPDTGDTGSGFDGPDFMRAILMAEYRKQAKNAPRSVDEIAQKIAPLLTIGKPLEHTTGTALPSKYYDFDGALLARFMAVEGRWGLLVSSPNPDEKGDNND
ncbi:Cas10/Cmr2 second palm domain-containing protein [Thalassospira povalilytica]|uniref:Cas10/Cmr2 second palm domain-containing protein n=1 Tax=Thalassospira povalilytica TaxID=732237 RepID=UPI003AA896ED